jgi:hypothetical protein
MADIKKYVGYALIAGGALFVADGALACGGDAFLPMPRTETTQLEYSVVDFVIGLAFILMGLYLTGHLNRLF